LRSRQNKVSKRYISILAFKTSEELMTHSTFLEILWHSSSWLSPHWSLRDIHAVWLEGKFL